MGKAAGKSPATFSEFETVLHETFGNGKTPSLDEIIDCLRVTFPEYGVKQTSDSKDKPIFIDDDDDGRPILIDDDDGTSSPPVSKKAKKIDSREPRLMESDEPELKLPSERVLRRWIHDKFGNATPSLDEIVRYLRSNFPEYNRHSPEAFTGLVKQTLDSSNKLSSIFTASKKEKKIDDDDGKPRFKDLGGMNGVLDELKMEVLVPLCHPQLLPSIGVKPTSGILLHGPPGCGKTRLAQAIANETGVQFHMISAADLVSSIVGVSEEKIRDLFSKAHRSAPSIVFIDEIDAIAVKRDELYFKFALATVTQLLTCMDESHNASQSKKGHVLVIGATNRPDALDPAIRRPGRFDREIMLGAPDENGRLQILSVLTRNMKLEGAFDLTRISRDTPGFVGADLAELMNKAGNLAVKRIIDERDIKPFSNEDRLRKEWTPEEMKRLSITMSDFEVASKLVQPSSRREGFSSIPDVKWEDIGGLEMLRREFERYIIRRIKHPLKYEKYGVDLEPGYLLYGPPGCGKTLIGKAVANEAGASFIHIKGPELMKKWIGESESAVRTIFSRARRCSPCVLFFDEIDAVTAIRGRDIGGGANVAERILNQLLIELDGAEQRKGVYVIGATNRPEVMDPAVLRPGRFGKLLYVPLPNQEERGLILKALARKKPIDADVDLMTIGRSKACANLSGADLSALMNEAAMAAAEEEFREAAADEGISQSSLESTIKAIHFVQALRKISPSVSDEQKEYYRQLSERFKST